MVQYEPPNATQSNFVRLQKLTMSVIMNRRQKKSKQIISVVLLLVVITLYHIRNSESIADQDYTDAYHAAVKTPPTDLIVKSELETDLIVKSELETDLIVKSDLETDLIVKSELETANETTAAQNTLSSEVITMPSMADPHLVVSEENCQLRDISNYTKTAVRPKNQQMGAVGCLYFKCNKEISTCDNALPTNYNRADGKPPCCVHILRDMARTFDNAMCQLGLDYYASFGTLLGLTRSDRFIPWTIDNDYSMPNQAMTNAMVDLWDRNMTGMAHIYQDIPRMCVTAEFAGGKLAERWRIPPPVKPNIDFAGFPYIDFYVGKTKTMTMGGERSRAGLGGSTSSSKSFSEWPGCSHNYVDVWPSKRALVYRNNTASDSTAPFYQRLPANVEQMANDFYGANWKTPDKTKDPHGKGSPCSKKGY